MVARKNTLRYLRLIGVIFLQLFMTQVVTFLLSLLLPDMENFPQNRPVMFVFVLGITFSVGVFLAGWLAITLHWLSAKPIFLARLLAALIGAYVPLIVALMIYPTLEPGNPFFFLSMLASILGFYLPGWIETRTT